MYTLAHLMSRTAKDLAKLAQKKRVPGWHSMRKNELIEALSAFAQPNGKPVIGKANGKPLNGKAANGQPVNGQPLNGKPLNGKPANGKTLTLAEAISSGKAAKNGAAGNGASTTSANGSAEDKAGKNGASRGKQTRVDVPPPKPRTPEMERQLAEMRLKMSEGKNLTLRPVDGGKDAAKDRLVAMVRDPYWIHAYWELSHRSVERAQAAMGHYWHGAKPVLRLIEVIRDGTTHAARKHLRDIEVHGGVNHWYVDVQSPPRSYQLEIGYLASDGKFHALAKSNVVGTPPAEKNGAFDKNWAEVAKDFDRIYAINGGYAEQEVNSELKEVLEERLHRNLGESMFTRFGMGGAHDPGHEFPFEIHTELIVHGKTDPTNRVTLRGEPVPVRTDGSFAVRFNLPDRRHVMPVVACTDDGAEQRTIILAVDRNTKVLEPVMRDPCE